MTIEEKAKRFDEAFEVARSIRFGNPNSATANVVCEDIFPELKEINGEKIRKELLIDIPKVFPHDKAFRYIAWLEKQDTQAIKEALRTEYEKGRADAIAEFEKQGEQKPANITDDWIEDYWQHEKVNNPDSYDKGEEIQFDHQGFVNFCRKYCQKPAEWSEEDNALIKNICTALKGYALHERKADLDEHAHRLEEMAEKLKSLKHQPHWKPSELDINLLERIANGKSNPQDFQASLGGLIGQLKKLKGE